MNEEIKEKQDLCLACLKCCKELWKHTVFANDSLGSIEFFEARGHVVEPSPQGVLVIKLKEECPHLTEKGCDIYENRPYVCKIYDGRKDHPECLWHTLNK